MGVVNRRMYRDFCLSIGCAQINCSGYSQRREHAEVPLGVQVATYPLTISGLQRSPLGLQY